jgi:hypothetical protein
MKPPQSNTSQVIANNFRVCFNCRETGHFIANCPYAKKPTASAFSNSVNGPRPVYLEPTACRFAATTTLPTTTTSRWGSPSSLLWMSLRQPHQHTGGSRGTRRSSRWVPGQLSLGNHIIWFRSITSVHILKFCGITQHTYSSTESTLVNPNARRWHQVSTGLLSGKDHFKWERVSSGPNSTEVQWNRCDSWDGLVKPTPWSYKLCR